MEQERFSRRWWTWVLCAALGLKITANASASDPAMEMANAARHFLASLDAAGKAKAQFGWQEEERLNWHFIPKDRQGLMMKEMAPNQRLLAQALLASGLSARGTAKASTIMALEKVLQDLEGPNRRFPRDPEQYHVSLFGEPSTDATWGWRVEGHHLSINFSIVGGKHVSTTPSFMGSNPAEVKTGALTGLRVLAAEEDLGRELVSSLDADQRKAAIIAKDAPADIITAAARKADPLEVVGVPYSRLNASQQELMRRLIQEYIGRDRDELAQDEWTKIDKAGLGGIYFAWAGGTNKGEGHYYRVQGPTFLLEYDCTQNDANHIHAVWRDFHNDFGADLLREHYEKSPHGQ